MDEESQSPAEAATLNDISRVIAEAAVEILEFGFLSTAMFTELVKQGISPDAVADAMAIISQHEAEETK